MQQPPPLARPASPAPKRTGWVVYALLATFLLCLSVLMNFGLFAAALGGEGRKGRTQELQFQEYLLQGDTDLTDKIAVVYLTGVISSGRDHAFTEEGMVGDLRLQLERAVEDKRVKAIILRINSPGGEVVASDAIYRAVAEARKEKPVIASIEAVGASGGYYAALGASHIIANDVTITGSIGVIMQSFTFGEMMDKVGLKSHTFKSGRYKDLLNPTREPTPEEKELVQTLIMEVYEKFVGVVAEERKMPVGDLKQGMADGRILSGQQALKAGFIDSLGGFDEAIEKASELAKIEEAQVVTYRPMFSLRQLLQMFSKLETPKIQVQIAPGAPKLEAGKLYYLPAYMFQ
jgi:protease-4